MNSPAQNSSKSSIDSVHGQNLLSRLKWGIQVLIGTGFFSGYVPLIPGTAGSAAGFVCMLFLPEEWYFFPLLLISVLIAGTWASEGLSRKWGDDPGKVVIDEVAGMIICLGPFPKIIPLYILGFILFRILDIFKPFPCRQLEKVPGGLGIMLDDIAAALYTCILLYGVFIFIG